MIIVKIVRAEGPNSLVDLYEGKDFELVIANRVLCRFASSIEDRGGYRNKIELEVTHVESGDTWGCRYDVRSILEEIPNVAERIRTYCQGPATNPELFAALYRDEEKRAEALAHFEKWIGYLEGCRTPRPGPSGAPVEKRSRPLEKSV